MGSWLSYGLLGSYTYSLRMWGWGPLNSRALRHRTARTPPGPGLNASICVSLVSFSFASCEGNLLFRHFLHEVKDEFCSRVTLSLVLVLSSML